VVVDPPGATAPEGGARDARVRGGAGRRAEHGKVGLAILLWILGVPGFLVLLYLLIG
jgi:hypothetical protein